MTDSTIQLALRQSLIDDAEYVAAELARGDAVPADVLVKAKPFLDPLTKAALAAQSAAAPGDAEFCVFQSAMVDLMTAIAPVTVSSLRDTETSGGPCVSPPPGLQEPTPPPNEETDSTQHRAKPSKKTKCVAGQFSNRLFGTTLVFLLVALTLTVAAAAHLNGVLKDSIAVLLPVIYGGLGASVYLLRSLHKHIHERTFDRRYQPEYWNRAVLGVVSGGVITVLVNANGAAATTTLQGVSTAALAFLVGYNTDLLFSLIERISNALFPKVADPPAPEAAVMPTPPPPTPPGDTADGKDGKKT